MPVDNEWIYDGKPFTPADVPEGAYSFVYLISSKDGSSKYIGKKLFWFKGKKTITLKNGKKRRKTILKESDWTSYYGSSEQFTEEVNRLGADSYDREILHICNSKAEASYMEAYEQFRRGVLFDPCYANRWIMVRVRAEHLKKMTPPR